MLDVRIAAPGATGDTAEAEAVTESGTPAEIRRAAGKLARAAAGPRISLARPGLSGERLTAFVEGLVLGAYRFSMASTAGGGLQRVDLVGVDDRAALDRGLLNARAAVWARDLANTPASVKTPSWLGTAARRELSPLGVQVTVHDGAWLAEHGFGALLAVGGGAAAGPRLIEAAWRPRGAPAGVHAVIVGKGVTYDTGGLNIKPGASMRSMHTDMSGGAAALAALRTVAALRLPLRVTVLVPSAENSVSGAAFRPGDVVRHYGGRTSEITNTDAEGRLLLADALAYASDRLRPSVLVDVATLTGAMKVALGLRTGGLFATTDALAKGLVRAGDAAGEPLWRMPLDDDYAAALHSDIADANNAGGGPGAITAALFLRPFTGGLPWAHLDIAGPARAASADGAIAPGATGFGARMLARWLESVSARGR